MENKIYDLLEKMYADFNERFIGLEKTTSGIKSQVNNNSLILEKIQTDIKTLAEVQSSFSEQLDRAKDKDGKTLGERLDAIDVIKDTTGSHEMDIKILKRIRSNHSL